MSYASRTSVAALGDDAVLAEPPSVDSDPSSVPPPPIGRPEPSPAMAAAMAAEHAAMEKAVASGKSEFPKRSGPTAREAGSGNEVPWAVIGVSAAVVGGLGLVWLAGRSAL